MQARGRGGAPPPIGIALEGDFGHRIDAVLAIAMLNGLAAKGEARTIAMCVSRTSVKAAQLTDVLVGFYSPRPTDGSSMVGMPESGRPDDAPPIAAMLAQTTPEGTPQYTSNISRVMDTADNAVLIRNMILAQQDRNASLVLAGPATGFVRLMSLYGARPQIETKVARLVVAIGAYPSGAYPSGAADPAVKADIAAARALFAEWPTPLIAVGSEVGEALAYPAASIETGLAWSPIHPVAAAYRAFRPMPYDAPTAALAATLHAVHPGADYFTLSEPGTITVLDDGRTQFKAVADGRHRYLKIDPARKAAVLQLFTDLVSAQPAPRPGRGGRRGAPPQQQQQKPPLAPPEAPPAAKPPTP